MNDLPLVSVVIPTHNRKEGLARLLDSLRKSTYPKAKMEIIVVSDSSDNTNETVKRDFSEAKLIVTDAGSVSRARNLGIKEAQGELIFLVDDDNVIDPNCIAELASSFSKHTKAGIVGPLMYYYGEPNMVWCGGVDRSMVTSLTKFIGRDEIDRGQFSQDSQSKDFPNAFMVRRFALDKAGGFDERLFPQHYEESDLAERVRRAGFEVICHPAAKVWHDIAVPDDSKDRLRSVHIHSERRAYYAGRNRVIFFRLYSKPLERFLYLMIFNWVFTVYYLSVILSDAHRPRSERRTIAKGWISGVIDGLRIKLLSTSFSSP